MELAVVVYLISFVGTLTNLLIGCIFLSFIAIFVTLMIIFAEEDCSWHFSNGHLKQRIVDLRKNTRIAFKYSGIILIVSAILMVFVPSEKTAWMMVGAYAGQKVAESPKVQEISGKVIMIIENKIDQYVSESINKTK